VVDSDSPPGEDRKGEARIFEAYAVQAGQGA
jgi:hypothetical protein